MAMLVLRILPQRCLGAVAAGARLAADKRGGRGLRRVDKRDVGRFPRKNET